MPHAGNTAVDEDSSGSVIDIGNEDALRMAPAPAPSLELALALALVMALVLTLWLRH